MTRIEARQWIQRGKFTTVEFTKRTTGERRLMLCRTGVKKYVSGKGMAYNPTDHGLITVFDIHKHEYRMIPIEGLRRVKVLGKWRIVK